MRGEVGRRFELVREEPLASVRHGRGVVARLGPGQVDEVLRRRDGRYGHALDRRAQMVEQIGLLHALVVRHADVRLVAPGPRERGQRDARAADGAFVDGVAAARRQESALLGNLDHVEGHPILGAAAAAVQELGLSQDGAPGGLGQAADLDQGRVADAPFDSLDDGRIPFQPMIRFVVFHQDRPEEQTAPP